MRPPTPEKPIAYTGFEEASRVAYYDTALALDRELVQRSARCELEAIGLPRLRPGGARGPLFEGMAPYLAWEVAIHWDAGAERPVCEGTIAGDYAVTRADDAALVAGDAPDLHAPLRQASFIAVNGARLWPDCAESEVDVVAARAEATTADVALVEARAGVEALAVARASANADLAVLGGARAHLERAEALARAGDAWPAAFGELRAAYDQIETLDAETTVAVSDALLVLLEDANEGHYLAVDFAAADDALATLEKNANDALDGLDGELADATAAMSDAEGKVAASRPRLADATERFRACRVGATERAAIAWTELEVTFPAPSNAPTSTRYARRWLPIVGPDGEADDAEVITGCAFGDDEHVTQVELEVRRWRGEGDNGVVGIVRLVRGPLGEGFGCEVDPAIGGCEVFPLSEIGCAADDRIPRSQDGYVLVDP